MTERKEDGKRSLVSGSTDLDGIRKCGSMERIRERPTPVCKVVVMHWQGVLYVAPTCEVVQQSLGEITLPVGSRVEGCTKMQTLAVISCPVSAVANHPKYLQRKVL